MFSRIALALAAQALSIFGDHSDVMSTRQTGFAMLATGSVQEIMDLAPIAHLAAIKARVPFLHFFDGFRTSHEIQKVEHPNQDALAALIDKKALKAYRQNALNPEHPVTRGTAQNPDIYFQTRELQNKYYEVLPGIVADYMKQISKMTGREYAPFTYYGAKDATHVVVAMGSVTETIKTVVDKLTNEGKKVGVVSVHLSRSQLIFRWDYSRTVNVFVFLTVPKKPGKAILYTLMLAVFLIVKIYRQVKPLVLADVGLSSRYRSCP